MSINENLFSFFFSLQLKPKQVISTTILLKKKIRKISKSHRHTQNEHP